MKRSRTHLLPLALLCLGLGGCQTLETMKSDFSSAMNDQKPPPGHEIITEDGISMSSNPCPLVQIVDELSSLSEFSPADSTSTDNLVSRVTLSQVDSACSFKGNLVSVDLKLAFEGVLGAKAKINKNDKPYFAYPFFLAVTDPKGVVLAKDVFAASMTYDRADSTHTYYEKLRQLIPIQSREQAASFKIMIGFQLDYDQLKYNRRNMKPVRGIASEAVKPDYSGIKSEISKESLPAPSGNGNKGAPINVIPAGN